MYALLQSTENAEYTCNIRRIDTMFGAGDCIREPLLSTLSTTYLYFRPCWDVIPDRNRLGAGDLAQEGKYQPVSMPSKSSESQHSHRKGQQFVIPAPEAQTLTAGC